MTTDHPSPIQDSTETVLTDPGQDSEDKWVPLKEASGVSGVPVSTLRKWYRADKIESRKDEDGRRLVRLEEVTAAKDRRTTQSTTLTLPARDIWGLYQQAVHDLQAALAEAAYLRGQVDVLRAGQPEPQDSPEDSDQASDDAHPRGFWSRLRRG